MTLWLLRTKSIVIWGAVCFAFNGLGGSNCRDCRAWRFCWGLCIDLQLFSCLSTKIPGELFLERLIKEIFRLRLQVNVWWHCRSHNAEWEINRVNCLADSCLYLICLCGFGHRLYLLVASDLLLLNCWRVRILVNLRWHWSRYWYWIVHDIPAILFFWVWPL